MVVAQSEYAIDVGCLMYLMQCARPYIAFSVSKINRYSTNLSAEHLEAIKRILCFLLKTKTLGLQYEQFPTILEGYTDAN